MWLGKKLTSVVAYGYDDPPLLIPQQKTGTVRIWTATAKNDSKNNRQEPRLDCILTSCVTVSGPLPRRKFKDNDYTFFTLASPCNESITYVSTDIISAKNHGLWVLTQTASMVTTIHGLNRNRKNNANYYLKNPIIGALEIRFVLHRYVNICEK